MLAVHDHRRRVRSTLRMQMAAPMLATLFLVACGQSGPAGSALAPSASPVAPSAGDPGASPQPPSAAPSTTLAPSASAVAAGSDAPAASGPCIDVGQLADSGDSVENQLDAIKTALDAKKVDDARSAAQTAGIGIKSLADIAGAASPQAKQLFLTAGTELTKAAAQFPNGASTFEQARTDFEQAFVVARAAGCPV